MKTGSSKGLALRSSIALFILIAAFLTCVGSLVRVALVHGEEYKLKAEKNQLLDTTISAERGTIYDSNMNVLAKSASAWLIYIVPSKIENDTQRDLVVEILSSTLSLDAESVREKTMRESNYIKIAGEVEEEQKDEIKKFISEHGKEKLSNIIGIDPDTKRYYPYSSFASSIIGFVNTDDEGTLGVELTYNGELTGVSGRIVTAKNARQKKMASEYETTYEAQQGANLVLTIDEVVQYYLEQSLDQAIIDTGCKYAYGIIMDVDTGAILAMTSKPDFDLNNPNVISNKLVADKISEILDEEEKKTETLNARFAQWRNRTVSDTYEPGSVFKTVVVSAALEENVVDLNTTYTCVGGIQVANNYQKCWRHGGHGTETLTQGLMNSCNPFFITIGQKLGKDKFFKYFEAFGFTEKTGIDVPAEANPVANVTYHALESMGISELSSSSFGQTFQVSPIQMVTAISAIANGGKLMTPYVVDSMLDSDGNVIKKTQPVVRRQVISEKTASTVADMMEAVVSKGTGKNAYVAGYHVAGKTGTSEKIGKEGAYIASFAGFAPANNPRIAILIAIDEPAGAHGGGVVAAPIAGQILEKVLTYLNVEPQYEDNEMANISSTAPALIGKTLQEARSMTAGYTLKIVGKGDKVIAQSPAADSQIRTGGVIVLYTEEQYEKQTAIVPDLTNMTMSQANSAAVNAGFNIRFSGTTNETEVMSYKQSLEANTEAELGSVITVYFRTTVNVQDA
ncbi:MAG: penicillin-binding transpeptidase domain-containing protein [Clostridiaceae bacterium]|nr:penicillin-binding transpeptidase domain-containing protein [Clostridiaceae bacterium]